jgi:hypothetical protein
MQGSFLQAQQRQHPPHLLKPLRTALPHGLRSEGQHQPRLRAGQKRRGLHHHPRHDQEAQLTIIDDIIIQYEKSFLQDGRVELHELKVEILINAQQLVQTDPDYI